LHFFTLSKNSNFLYIDNERLLLVERFCQSGKTVVVALATPARLNVFDHKRFGD
jgi:hypothetical protein